MVESASHPWHDEINYVQYIDGTHVTIDKINDAIKQATKKISLYPLKPNSLRQLGPLCLERRIRVTAHWVWQVCHLHM